MKKLSLVLIAISISSLFIGCSKEEFWSKPGEKNFGDRSSQMAVVPLTDEQYKVLLIEQLAPICQNAYDLNSQAIAIKNGRIDISTEIPKIESYISNIQTVRDMLSDTIVNSTKKDSKEKLIVALDSYSTELRDYENLLKNEKITRDELQSKVDQVINSIEAVKQYMK